MGPELGQPPAKLSAYKLSGSLESAIRASNAQFDDPDILGRLRVRMLSAAGGEVGWDVFSLEYQARESATKCGSLDELM